jgi:flagellar assembly protein FliH
MEKKPLEHAVVIAFQPKDIPLVISKQAKDFHAYQGTGDLDRATDFQISPLVAEMSGVAELSRRDVDDKVEALALERLKEVQEAAYKEAYELGHIEGGEKGFEEKRAELTQVIARMDEILKAFDGFFQKMLNEHEIHLVRLVCMIASRIAMKEIQVDKELIISVLNQVLEESQLENDIVVVVSKDDLSFIDSLRERLDKRMEKFKRVKLEVGETMQAGGCWLETQFGVIDATVEERVKKALEAVESKMPHVTKAQGPTT